MHKNYRVVALAGSPSRHSSTAAVVEAALCDLPDDVEGRLIALNAIDPAAFFGGRPDDPALRKAIDAVALADGVILGTPVYKASMSGLLKAFIDLLPQYALAGKAVWPIATGGSLAHALALDYGIRPILQSMGARHVIQSVFFTPADLAASDGSDVGRLMGANARYVEALQHFVVAMRAVQPVPLLGHPLPERSAGRPAQSCVSSRHA